jgi:hypothetical protein
MQGEERSATTVYGSVILTELDMAMPGNLGNVGNLPTQ